MAPSIRHPLRPLCFIKINVIVLVLCSCAAVCHSDDTTSVLYHKIESGNSANKEDIGCHTACHLTTKPMEKEVEEETTVNKPELVVGSNGSTRHARSLLEDLQKLGHQREGRAGALNKNFLRFGRGNLNKNFLRFGRGGNLKQNFLRFGRGGLQKNFLRFGRKDGEYDFDSGEKSDLGVLENLANNGESTDLQSSIGNAENLMKAIERLRSELDENQEESMEKQENGESFVDSNADGSLARGPGAFEMEENGAKVKRGSLSNNFLRFGRTSNNRNMFGGKRGSLNRNFLRFGKRSGPPDVNDEEEREQKVKREVGLDKVAEGNEAGEKLPMPRNKKSVLFLASPWLSSQTEVQQSAHGDSIRRRSLDGKLSSQLNNNFIRFG